MVTGWKSELWKSEYTVHEYDPIPAHKPSLRSRKALQGRQRSRFCQGHGASGTPLYVYQYSLHSYHDMDVLLIICMIIVEICRSSDRTESLVT